MPEATATSSPPPWRGVARVRRGKAMAKKKKAPRQSPHEGTKILPPGTCVEVLRSGSWVGSATVIFGNARTYMVHIKGLPPGKDRILAPRSKLRVVTAPSWPSAHRSSPAATLASGTPVLARRSKRLWPGLSLVVWEEAEVVSTSEDGYLVRFAERSPETAPAPTLLLPGAHVWPTWESHESGVA